MVIIQRRISGDGCPERMSWGKVINWGVLGLDGDKAKIL